MVAEAAVVAVADDQWGRRSRHLLWPTDRVIERSATHRLHRGAGSKRTRRRVAARDIVLMDSLPTLPTGKIDREQLRSLAAQS